MFRQTARSGAKPGSGKGEIEPRASSKHTVNQGQMSHLPPGGAVVQRGTNVDDRAATRAKSRERSARHGERPNSVDLHHCPESVHGQLLCRRLNRTTFLVLGIPRELKGSMTRTDACRCCLTPCMKLQPGCTVIQHSPRLASDQLSSQGQALSDQYEGLQ